MSNLQQVRKGAVYLYIETISSMVSGYFFWLIMSKVAAPDVIGLSSALISLSTIFVSVINLGIPNAIPRFIGKGISNASPSSEQNTGYIIRISLALSALAILVSSAVLISLRGWIYSSFNTDPSLVAISLVLVGATIVSTLFRSIIIAGLRTKQLSIISIVSSLTKLGLALALVFMGLGAIGLTIGYTVNQVLACLLMAFVVVTIVQVKKQNGIRVKSNFFKVVRELMTASGASWIPAAMASVGMQLGTVLLFGAQGAKEAGVYFIALSVMTAVSGVAYSMFNIAYPVLSGMTDRRKVFTSRVLKISLLISLPISSSLMFYTDDVLSFLGTGYRSGSVSLEILLLSMLPTVAFTGINVLTYAYGNYKQVLAIGLASNAPRILLYFLLVPAYGSVGAASSFTIGALAGFIVAIEVARRIRLQLPWRNLFLMFGIPTALGYGTSSVLHVPYFFGIPSILFVSYVAFLKFGIFTSGEVNESLNFLPQRISMPLTKVLKMIERQV